MDAQVVAAVRELLARAPGVGVNAMVKHIRGEWPELADRVNAKVVRQAKAVLAVEAAAAEGEKGGGGAAAGGSKQEAELADWVAEQVVAEMKGELTADQIAKLDALGADWRTSQEGHRLGVAARGSGAV